MSGHACGNGVSGIGRQRLLSLARAPTQYSDTCNRRQQQPWLLHTHNTCFRATLKTCTHPNVYITHESMHYAFCIPLTSGSKSHYVPTILTLITVQGANSLDTVKHYNSSKRATLTTLTACGSSSPLWRPWTAGSRCSRTQQRRLH